MDEIAKTIMDYGVTSILIISIFYLGFKYVPKLIDISIARMAKKDYRDDLLKSQIESNTQALKAVEKVVEHNTAIIKQNTDNRHKLENEINDFKILISNNEKNIINELNELKFSCKTKEEK